MKRTNVIVKQAKKKIGVVGINDAGKTLFSTLLGKLDFDHGEKIYSNYDTTFSKRIENRDIEKFKINKCTLLLDEIATMIDSRAPPMHNIDKCYYFLQSRKRETKVIFTTQAFIYADKRLRLVTDRLYHAFHFPELETFVYHLYVNDGSGSFVKPKGSKPLVLPYEVAQHIFPLYDTEEPIYPESLILEENIDFDVLINEEKDLPTKRSWIEHIKSIYPVVPENKLKGIYDLLKVGKVEKARQTLFA